jgi:hypothetical protein
VSILPNHWYYNTETGQLTQGNNLENLGNNLVGGAGWHELNVPGNATEAQAASGAVAEFPSGKAPTTAGITPARVAGVAAGEAGGAIASWTQGLSSLLSDLGSRAFWVRIAEVVIGAALLIVAIAELAKGTPAGDVAKKAGEAAFIL